MKKILLILALCHCTTGHAQRSRHVSEEWNTKAINLNEDMIGSSEAWHYLNWFGSYYQTGDWWIYHCEKGWLYPESDGDCGVWLYYPAMDSWIWAHCDVYPYAWNSKLNQWFNFCEKPLAVAITE